ncbi:11155_t:CDS:2 [Acaulospora colombiana]|uniref:11155_t:CDS:1 n=1 Tax=Acaulospora colombiana TaxID=27376 RepID=A0ACA9LMI8_9GLOM|nr:11155_t:CDS:2 [Acaulospora colombiana]
MPGIFDGPVNGTPRYPAEGLWHLGSCDGRISGYILYMGYGRSISSVQVLVL